MKAKPGYLAIALATAVMIAGGGAGPLRAEGADARVLVPEAPQGAIVTGCYRATTGLYGPYTLKFCLERRGTYSVRGDGIRCDGRLDWDVSGRDVAIDLRRQSCNQGVAWEAAEVICRPRSLLDAFISGLLGKPGRDPQGRVLVPDNPKVGALRCVYYPRVAGERRVTFLANRI